LDGDRPVARTLPTHRTTQTQNKRTEMSMPRVGFEPTIPVFERAEAVHTLDRVATVTGLIHDYNHSEVIMKIQILEFNLLLSSILNIQKPHIEYGDELHILVME
jgi:hypothetical protein